MDRLYNSAGTQKEKLYYSKLAMLELCGWIEESMDDIVEKCAHRVLKKSSNKTYVAKNIIRPTYGFEYEKHFRKMLMSVIGLKLIEKLENKVDAVKHTIFTAELNNLKAARNKEAHTHLKGVTRTVDAPSVTITRFHSVYEGLKDIENTLKRLKH